MTTDTIPSHAGTYNHAVKAIVLNRILLILSFIGLFVAGALSVEKALNISLPCGNSGGCETVAADPSSMLFGVIPVAYIGFAGYILFAALAIIRTMGTPNDAKLVKIGFAAAGIGALYSVYLQFLSFTKIHAVCPYCLTSAVVMILTVIVYAMLNGTVGQEIAPEEFTSTGRKIERDVPKLDMWLIAGLPLIIVVSLGIMASAQKPAAPALVGGKEEPTLAALLANDPKTYGTEGAPLTIVEFFDMCCPPCQKKSPLVKAFAAKHEGKVRIVFRNFPLQMHQYGKVAAAMGEYASEKGKFLDFMMSVMALDRQPESAAELLDIAKHVGLDPEDMKKRLKDANDPLFQRVTDDINLGHKVGVDSTPTFIVFAPDQHYLVAGPNDIMDKLESDQYKKVLSGSG